MRVLFVTHRLAGGGAERALSVFANALVKQGHEVGVFINERGSDDYRLDRRIVVLSPDRCIYLRNNRVVRKGYRIWNIYQAIYTYKPQLCIPFLPDAVVETFIAAKPNRVPVIAAIRCAPADFSSGGLRTWLENIAYEHSAAVFFQTERQKEFFSEKVRKKSFVVPNAVGDEYLEIGKNRKHAASIRAFVACGRLAKQKNYEMLIEAFCIVRARGYNVTLRIYGDGNLQSDLERKIICENAADFIKIMGKTNNIRGVLKEADAFVLSSNYEGMPNALMEAMAAKLPCVATDCLTGPRELLGNNERGLVVKPNDKQEMADAIIRLIEDEEAAIVMAQSAYSFIQENFRSARISGQLAENINSVLSGSF